MTAQDPKGCYNCHHATYHEALGATRTEPPEEAWFYCALEDATIPAHAVERDIQANRKCPTWSLAKSLPSGIMHQEEPDLVRRYYAADYPVMEYDTPYEGGRR